MLLVIFLLCSMLEHCTELVGQRRGLSLGRRGDPGERRWCGRTLSVVAVAGTGEAWIPFRGAAGRTPTPGLGVGGAAMTRADGPVSEPGKVVHAGTGSQQSGSGPAGLSLSATTVGVVGPRGTRGDHRAPSAVTAGSPGRREACHPQDLDVPVPTLPGQAGAGAWAWAAALTGAEGGDLGFSGSRFIGGNRTSRKRKDECKTLCPEREIDF